MRGAMDDGQRRDAAATLALRIMNLMGGEEGEGGGAGGGSAGNAGSDSEGEGEGDDLSMEMMREMVGRLS